ncbi:MAG TPA: DUF364 domain-containing protein [Anaeromyxobacteraceae bacterium]|nr:DUF364 domain-containing protein [Anaeromyxobacteraceae bacterium]
MEQANGTPASDAILRETMSALRDLGGPRRVTLERVVVGLFFTGVKLSNGHGGVCFTPLKSIPEAVCCPSSAKALPFAGKLRGREALQVAQEALSGGPLQKAIGIAVMNALTDAQRLRERPRGYTMEAGVDPIDELVIPEGASVVVVGALVPYLRLLKARGKPFRVLEQDPVTLKADELPFYAPAERATEDIPRADVLIITGTTLINGTLDGLLALARPGTHITVVGPTASMVPDALFRRGVRLVGGIRVTDPDALLETLAEGGSGYHFFGRSAEKILLRSDS